MNGTLLKLKDTDVMKFNSSTYEFEIYRNDLLPVRLRDVFKNPATAESVMQMAALMADNNNILMDFFRHRTLSVKRANAKKIFNALNISQEPDSNETLQLMILCKALSVCDDYWITNNPNDRWENVNVRDNPLHKTIQQVALKGSSSKITITGEFRTPELTSQGAYAKTWIREKDGLYLCKASSKGGKESITEVEISNLLDYTNVPHVKYFSAVQCGVKVCKCKNLCTDKYSIVSSGDVYRWCNRKKEDFNDFVLKVDSENFYKMAIVDYLISNSDRHMGNWGFFMDNDNGELLGLHPLFDHNNGFDKGDMVESEGGQSQTILGKTKFEAAKFALEHCDFQIESRIPRYIFTEKNHKTSFLSRIKTLNLKCKVE